MGVFGNYDNQALPNLLALQAARAKVINTAQEIQEKLRSNPAIPRPISGGNGKIINILV